MNAANGSQSVHMLHYIISKHLLVLCSLSLCMTHLFLLNTWTHPSAVSLTPKRSMHYNYSCVWVFVKAPVVHHIGFFLVIQRWTKELWSIGLINALVHISQRLLCSLSFRVNFRNILLWDRFYLILSSFFFFYHTCTNLKETCRVNKESKGTKKGLLVLRQQRNLSFGSE